VESKLHSENLHNLYSSPNIIRVIKQRRMRWAEHLACMGDSRKADGLSVGKPEGMNNLKDADVQCVGV
jgi:hypothetical protein